MENAKRKVTRVVFFSGRQIVPYPPFSSLSHPQKILFTFIILLQSVISVGQGASFAESVVHTSRVCVAKRHIVCSCARETL